MAMKQSELLPAVVPQVFEHEQFGNLRGFMINDDPWFVAIDVCRALDIKNTTQAVKQLADDEKAMFNIGNYLEYPNLNIGYSSKPGNPNVNCVNESGLYRLIFSSRKPEAEKFRRWVFHEVLPSIRKTGFYSVAKKENLRELPHFKTDEEWFEYYERLQEQVPYMTEEEKLELSADPDIFVYKVNDGEWQVKFLLI